MTKASTTHWDGVVGQKDDERCGVVSELEHGCGNVAWLVNVKRGVVDELESVLDVV